MDDKYRQPEEIGVAKSLFLANGSVLKMVSQNAGEAALSYHQGLIHSQTTNHGLSLISVLLDLSEESPT